jgi:hypothetical protein
MIEVKRRGFAPVAAVLSFIAGNRDKQESIRWRLDCRQLQIQTEFSRAGDKTSLVTALVT